MHQNVLCGIALGFLASIACAAEQAKPCAGRVVDENGKTLPGVKVAAFDSASTAAGETEVRELGVVSTDAAGRFEFGRWTETTAVAIVATKTGRCLDWARWSSKQDDEPVLRLGPPAIIEGEIVGDDGQPVVGASVHALLQQESPEPRRMYVPLPGGALTVKTDAQGRFRFAHIPQGATVGFDVTAPAKARVFAEPQFAPGQKGLRFVLPPEGRIEGVVVEKGTDQPLAEVHLLAVGSLSAGVQRVRAKTDGQGRFRMVGMSGGTYDIEIVGPRPALPEWLGSVEEVRVDAGNVTSSVRIDAYRGGTLELALTDALTGKPVAAAAVVHVAPADDVRISEWGRTSNEGVAQFYLSPRDYVVTEAWVPGYSYEPKEGKSFRVDVGLTERASLVVRPIPRVADVASVTGVALDLTGKPVPGAKIQILPLGGTPRDIVAAKDGTFAVPAADIGPWFCFLSGRHPQSNLASLDVVEKDVAALQITLRPPAQVSGRVHDAQGRAVSGAVVQAQIDVPHITRSAPVATTRTGQDGRYRLELGGTGMTYAITAEAPGYGLGEIVVPQHRSTLGSVTSNDITLQIADRSIHGVAMDLRGTPTAGVIVWAKLSGGPRFPTSVVTDEQGQFVLENLTKNVDIYLISIAPGRGWTCSVPVGSCGNDVTITLEPSDYY